MKKRLYFYTALILLFGIVSYFIVSVYVTGTNNLNLAKNAVEETARICAALYHDGMDLAAFVDAGNDTRITVISPDGAVLADSRPLELGALEQHLNRPEIAAAANGVPEAHVRYSATLGAELIYYALKVASGDSYVFIRTAMPVAEVATYSYQFLLQSLPFQLIIVVVCFFIIRRMIGRVTRPLEFIEGKLRSLLDGGYTHGTPPGSFEEINEIIRGLDEIATKLQSSFHELRDETTKLDYILDNIGDGLFAVDKGKNVLLVNAAALRIFGATREVTGRGLNYLSYDKTIAAAVDDCIVGGKDALFDLALHGHIYCVAVKRLAETGLTVAVMSDVTENRENAKRREEFFSNASHELKTPLTAIKGFNELTAMHSCDENILKYVGGISRETDRMLSLIDDMLKLSELESAGEKLPEETVSLFKIADEVRRTLAVTVDEKAIKFTITGDAGIAAAPDHVYEVLKNLIENAVRYTDPNGSVTVKIEGGNREAKIVVADNGIGIPPEEQTRIFERFYRVEKSRSQRGGGTGLGLAIVKHICLLYNWKLSLKSRPGAGTEVTLRFGAGN